VPNYLKSALVFIFAGIVGGIFLTGVNLWAEETIEERQLQQELAILEDYFPGVASYKEDEVEGMNAQLVYGKEKEFLGVLMTTRQQGYSDYIVYQLAVDRQGKIVGLKVLEHNETEDIGGVIEEPEFREQFLGVSFQDTVSEKVEVVSGATESTRAIIDSVEEVMEVVEEEYLNQ